MILKITCDCNELNNGISILSEVLGFEISDQGICVEVTRNKENMLKVSISNDICRISYDKKTDFFRCFAILYEQLKKGSQHFNKEEHRRLRSDGIMLDMSRNAVMRPEALKDFLRRMALMGLDTLQIYMEDVYELEGYPYFGYMRGAYTKAELQQIVAYADDFGIEVIPCIQTLAHLENTLKWRYSLNMQDTPSILLVGEPQTYAFIEKMIQTVSECFQSKKIHIGMDEAHGLGMGAYFKKHGYKDRYSIMSKHLEKVMEIVRKYDLEPMMWSDMFFRLGSETGEYYDINCKMPDNIQELIPAEIDMVYWDYYTESDELYNAMFEAHSQMGRNVIFAGGIWIWGNVVANYGRTMRSTRKAMKACEKYGVKDIFATIWGDDGAETSRYETLLGMQLFAEFGYYSEVSDEHLARMFHTCTGYDMEAFMLFDVDDLAENETAKKLDDLWQAIPLSKQMLYQDVLLGLFDENYKDMDLEEKYGSILQKLSGISPQGDMEFMFEYQRCLIDILKRKSRIGIKIYETYHAKDISKLKVLQQQVMVLQEDMKKLHRMRRDIWLRENKAFGLEVIDQRFGGVIARLECASERLKDYLEGRIAMIEELEIEKLPYNNTTVNHDEKICYEWRFQRIVSVRA